MSDQRQQIKRTTVTSPQMQRTGAGKQLLTTNITSGAHIQHASTTGYQGHTGITTSHVINSRGEIVADGHNSMQRSRHRAEYEGEESDGKFLLNGETDFVALKNMKGAMLDLINEFRTRGALEFQGEYRQNFEKRLVLMEKQLDGLMRKSALRSQFTDQRKAPEDGTTLNLQYRINSLQQTLKKAQSQLFQVEQLNKGLKQELKSKVAYIQELSRLLEKGLPHGSQLESTQAHLASLEAQLNAIKPHRPTLATLESTVQGWILGLPIGSFLQKKLEMGTLRTKEDDLHKSMVEKLRYAQDMFRHELAEIQRLNPSINLPSKSKVLDLLAASNTSVHKVGVTGVVQIEREVVIEKEVGVPDANLKALIGGLAKFIRKILHKYPKLKQEVDVDISRYISLEIIDQLVEGDINRLIAITQFVPQVIRVQDVYQHGHAKTRKIEFHLKVLIKALLEELERLRLAHGLEIALDEGVLGLMQAEIGDLIDIESVIALFRPIPKIVEVPKVIEKVADSVVTIPEKYVVRETTAKIVPIKQTAVVHDEKGVGYIKEVPVELVRQVPVFGTDYAEKPVIYTQYSQVPVNQVLQKTKAMEVPVNRDVVVERDRPVEIPGADHIVIQKELKIEEVVKHEARYLETVLEVIKPVEIVVEKLVEKLVEREKAVAVPVIQEKLVKETVYQIIKENNPIIVTNYEVVPEYHEKVVEFIRDRDKIVQVPQVIEKLVPVQRIIEQPPKLVEVKEQVMVTKEKLEIVEIPRTEVVIKSEQVPVQVIEHVERPLFVEVVKVEKEIANVPMIQDIVKEIHIPVQISKPCIIKQDVPVEVISSYPEFIKEEIPVIVKEEQTTPIPFYYDRIKTEVQTVEKIIEKIVEVPTCVEVEKIVEKIIIVPRIVEKIVEVPQIIEKIVERIVEVPKEMPPIERIIERPCIREVPVEVPVEKIIYLTVEKEKVVVEQVLVKDLETKTKEVPREIFNERVVVEKVEKPVEVFRDRVEYMYVDNIKVVKVDNVIVHPVEVPVPIVLEKDLPIPIIHETVNFVSAPQRYDVIVPEVQEVIRIEKVDVVHKIPIIQDQVKIVDRDRVVVQTKYEEVKLIEQKIVEVTNIIEQIKEVPVIFEQIVPIVKEVAKVYEFDKDPKLIETPGKVEIIEKVKPYIVNVNKYIERIVEKLVEVPFLIRQANVQNMVQEKMVPGAVRTVNNKEAVQLTVEKSLLREVEKKVVDTVVRIDEVMKCATEIIEKDRDPVIITKDRIMEVPYVLEKIVEKITLMPQVVEVLKHVVEVIDHDDINVLVNLDVEVTEYKQMSAMLEQEMTPFLEEMRKLRSTQPQLAGRIEVIQRYFGLLKKFIKNPRLIERMKESKAEPVRQVVRVPHQKTAEEAKDDLAKVLLIEQLLAALRKIGAEHRNINLENYLEKELMVMFDINFNASVKRVNDNFNSQLKKFQSSIEGKFSKLSGWGTDHNLMLKSFIDERFQLANVIKKTKEINNQLTAENNELREKLERERDVPIRIIELLIEFNQFMPRMLSVVDKDRHKELYQSYSKLLKKFENFKRLYDSNIGDSYFSRTIQLDEKFIDMYKGSCLRQFVREMDILKEKVRTSNWRENQHGAYQATIEKLKAEIAKYEALLRIANSKNFQLEQRERSYHSPKRSENTHVTHREKKEESRYVPGSQSDVEAYGQNFGEYVISDQSQAGMITVEGGIRRQGFQNYNSQVEPIVYRDLAGSAATYRSNQVTTSAQNIRVQNPDNLSLQSSKKTIEGNIVSYGSNNNGSSSYGSGSQGSNNYGTNARYGSDHNLIASQYQAQGTGGMAGSTYGNNVKITTSRITGNEGAIGATGTRVEGSYSREGATGTMGTRVEGSYSREVPTTTRKYQFHEKKYENARET